MPAKRRNGKYHPPIYRSYVFRDKDPVIDQLRTMAQRASKGHRLNYTTLRRIQDDGGPTVSCMAGWFFGTTKRPQNPTVEATGRALGKKRVWVDL